MALDNIFPSLNGQVPLPKGFKTFHVKYVEVMDVHQLQYLPAESTISAN